jgi:hypothetical protein
VPHLTLILYDFIILFSSNKTADEPHSQFSIKNKGESLIITQNLPAPLNLFCRHTSNKETLCRHRRHATKTKTSTK